MKRLTLLALLFIVAWLPARAQAPQTVQQLVYQSPHIIGPSGVVSNVNQSSHWLSTCISGQALTINIWLEASPSGLANTWQPISPVSTQSNGCGIVWAGGYWFDVRANFTVVSGSLLSSGVVSTYTGAVGPLALPQNAGQSFTSQVTTYQPVDSTAASGTGVFQFKSAGLAILTAGGVLYGGTLYNPNAGTVYVGLSNATGTVPSSAAIVIAVPATTSITLNLPAQGVYFSSLAASCSTALASNADPASNCVFTALSKPSVATIAPYNGVPN
jgi:hypothetical protein